MEHVHFEHFVVNNDSNPKMNICHVFQPACCSMVLLNIYTPSEPLECDPFRDINIYICILYIGGKQIWFICFSNGSDCQWAPLVFSRSKRGQLQQADWETHLKVFLKGIYEFGERTAISRLHLMTTFGNDHPKIKFKNSRSLKIVNLGNGLQ